MLQLQIETASIFLPEMCSLGGVCDPEHFDAMLVPLLGIRKIRLQGRLPQQTQEMLCVLIEILGGSTR